MSLFDLTGKRALVTGSTQGIGKAIALCLSDHGVKVFIHGLGNIAKCERVADQIRENRGDAHCCVGDLSEESCGERLYAQTGDIDILILNASLQIRNEWNKITSEEFDRQIKVNFRASLELIKVYEPYMRKKGWGRIITIGSVQQYKPHKDMLVYAGTKEAQMSLVKNLAKQFAPVGITVNNMSPGAISTPRNDKVLSDESYRRLVCDGIPCGFVGDAEDCVGAVLMLCSESSRYITGIDLIVDGGMHL